MYSFRNQPRAPQQSGTLGIISRKFQLGKEFSFLISACYEKPEIFSSFPQVAGLGWTFLPRVTLGESLIHLHLPKNE